MVIIFLELHLSIQAERHDKLLSINGFDTVGALQTLTPQNLLELGVSHGHLLLIMNALFPPDEQVVENPNTVDPT